MELKLQTKYNSQDKVFYISSLSNSNEISEEKIAYTQIETTITANGEIHNSINYGLYNTIAGTLFSEKNLFATKEDAVEELVKRATKNI